MVEALEHAKIVLKRCKKMRLFVFFCRDGGVCKCGIVKTGKRRELSENIYLLLSLQI
jgi:hypothetical protein